jgi:hypothetical protein
LEAIPNNKTRFTKSVGIIFIEPLKWNWTKHNLNFDRFVEYFNNKKPSHKLNFDQYASTHVLLQMNRVQDLFDFQVITIQLDNLEFPTEDDKSLDDLLKWLDKEVAKFENSEKGKGYNIDYWFGITSIKDERNWFFKISDREGKRSGKRLGIITSYRWEEWGFSPLLCLNILPLVSSTVVCLALMEITMVHCIHISTIEQKGVLWTSSHIKNT